MSERWRKIKKYFYIFLVNFVLIYKSKQLQYYRNNIMRIKLFFLSSLLLFANYATAYKITGIVTGGGEPLLGVVITRIGINGDFNSDVEYSVTDMDGKYEIESGSGDIVLVVASFVSYMTEMKQVEGSVVNFDLKETPYVPVKFFSTLLDQNQMLDFIVSQQIKKMGVPGFVDFNMFLSGDSLIFSINSTKDSAAGYDIQNYAETMIKSYLEQLRQEGELNNFISEIISVH